MYFGDLLRDFDNSDKLSVDTLALEEILQEERANEISDLNLLNRKVSFLHTSLLYYRNAQSNMGLICYDAWKTIVKKVGGTPNTWRDLGCLLDVSQTDLEYITNSIRDDPADIVLKVFMQNENATLDKLVDAFLQMKRYDILKAIEVPLTNLALCFSKDSGYYSSSKNSGPQEIITFSKNIENDLPSPLKKKIDKDQSPKQPLLRSPEKTRIEKKDATVLFLTYTEDGLETALNIQQYVENWDYPRVTILTLNNNRDQVYPNPEKFIREHFEKADFVVPIVTTGYLNQINSNTPQMLCTSDNLDYKYVTFIYNLLVNHYIYTTGCLNDKSRSVIPKNAPANILSEITMYPTLLPWTYEIYFDEQFKEFMKKESFD